MLRPRLSLAVLAVVVAACGSGGDDKTTEPATPTPAAQEQPKGEAYKPPPGGLPRLSQAQYKNALADLFGEGLTLPSGLEPDEPADGLLTAGAAVSSISPRGAEVYEEAARGVADQVVEAPERLAKLAACAVSGGDEACLRSLVEGLGRRVLRRPLEADEVEAHLKVGVTAWKALDFKQGVAWVIASLLQSPEFLYRVELGQGGKLTDFELATKLALFMWNTTPDDELLDAAAKGELSKDEGLRAQAERLLASDRARGALRNFFDEWLELYKLASMKKDPNIFKHYSPDLGASAREETLRFAEHLAFEKDAELGDYLTSRVTFVDRRLAAIYNVPATVEDGFGQIELPEGSQRRGLLGQVSFLALHSHPVSSSATQRGLFLREALLCQSQPDPPSNLNTAIPQPSADAKTLRQRLTVHMEVPSCAACHRKLDVPGLGFESFDGIGMFRWKDNGESIDASGDLDGVPFRDFRELTQVVAEQEALTKCVVRKMYTYASARPVTDGEEPVLEALTEDFVKNGRRLKQLMVSVVMSEGFRTVGEVMP